jgi:hypothetical protein
VDHQGVFAEWNVMVDDAFDPGDVLDHVSEAGYVEVLFAKSMGEANQCRTYLEDHQIPAQLEPAGDSSRRGGFAVLVPSEMLVEASELLAAREDEEDEDVVAGGEVDEGDDFEADDDDDDFDDDEDEEDDFDDDEDEDEGPEDLLADEDVA